MKKILSIICCLTVFLAITGCSKVSKKMAEQHLEDKYNENFTYVKLLDSPVSVSDITNGKEYHFISENGDNISVVCGKQGDKYSCVDGYYQYLIYEDMYNEIKTIISKYLPNIKMKINFISSIFENSWNKDTLLNQALSENSINLNTNVRIFTYDLDENMINQIEKNMWYELEQRKLSLNIQIYNISIDEYNNLHANTNSSLSDEEYDSFMDKKGYSFKATLSKNIKNY